MRRLFVFSALSTLLFGAAIGIIVTAAHGLSPSKSVQEWHITDCILPCFAGVTLGQITIAEAKEAITKRLGPSGYVLEATQAGENALALVWWRRDLTTNTFTSITITFYGVYASLIGMGDDFKGGTPPSFGDLISVLGTPSCAVTDARFSYLTVFYLGKSYLLTINGSSLSPKDPAQSITIQPLTSARCEDIRATKWRGFTNMMAYIR